MKKLCILLIILLLILPFSTTSFANLTVVELPESSLSNQDFGEGYTNITVQQAWDMTQTLTDGKQIPIDVRRDDEWIDEHIQTPYPQHAHHWPNLQVGENLAAFLQEYHDKEVIIYCRTGVRSYTTVTLLIDNGFDGTIYHMLGGIVEWKNQQLPTQPNQAPETPSIIGPSTGEAGIKYEYILTTFDSDYADVCYVIDWGTSFGNEIIGPYSSIEETTVSYTWNRRGTFEIKVKSIDMYDFESDWASLTIVMPVPHHPFIQFLQQLMIKYPNFSVFLNFIINSK